MAAPGQASPDLLRELMQGFINNLLPSDADRVCGAANGVPAMSAGPTDATPGRRDLDTRIGTPNVAVPKLREGSYFPDVAPLASDEWADGRRYLGLDARGGNQAGVWSSTSAVLPRRARWVDTGVPGGPA